MVEKIIDILEKIREKITDDSDLLWTSFETAFELRSEIDNYILQLREGNKQIIKEVSVHFEPTSTFQEHSIQNNWSKEYLRLAEEFDVAINKIQHS